MCLLGRKSFLWVLPEERADIDSNATAFQMLDRSKACGDMARWEIVSQTNPVYLLFN
jgi:hypothetical protein